MPAGRARPWRGRSSPSTTCGPPPGTVAGSRTTCYGTSCSMWPWLRSLEEIGEAGTCAALVTVVRCSGSTPAAPGAKMVVRADGSLSGTVGGGHLEQLVTADALACMSAGEG